MSKCRMIAICDEKELALPLEPVKECPVIDVCLPFGGRLFSEGGCLNHTPGNPPPDGIYGKIVIANGCITELHLADIPIYTSPPCAPIPSGCSGESGDMPDPSPTAGNLFRYDASGRPLVRLTISAGNGISVVGDGTTENPLVITNTQQSQGQTWVQSGNAAIQVTGDGSNTTPFRIAHATNLSGNYAGFTFDEFGHLISYTSSGSSMFISGIVEGDGIKVDTDPRSGIATIALADPINVVTDVFRLGAWDVEFFRNRLVRITRSINAPSGTYRFGNYDVAVNEFGSVTNITYVPPPADDPTLVRAAVSKRFTSAGEQRTMSFRTEKAGSFRIMYQASAVPSDIVLYINNVVIIGTREANRFNAIAPAIYAAGAHTVTIMSNSGFTEDGYMDMFMTVVA